MKNRTFWFGDYEGLRDNEGVPRVRQVPTAAEKQGLFSTAVVDPFAAGRPQFAQNAAGQWVIPRERWDPVGAAIVALIPDPNVAGTTIFASTPVTKVRQDQFDVRLDHQITPTLSMFGRYSFVDTDTFRPAPLPGLAEGSFNDAFGSSLNRSQGLALGATWVASSQLVGDFRLGLGARELLHVSAELRRRWTGRDRTGQRAERRRDRGRHAQVQHPGLRCGGPAHVDAAVPDAAVVESACDVQLEPRRPLREVRRRVPARPDPHQRSQRHDRPPELRQPVHQPRRRRPAPRPALAARPHQLHGDGSGAGHAVLLRAGRLQAHLLAHHERRPALRIRDAAAREGQQLLELRSGRRADDLRQGRRRVRSRARSTRTATTSRRASASRTRPGRAG